MDVFAYTVNPKIGPMKAEIRERCADGRVVVEVQWLPTSSRTVRTVDRHTLRMWTKADSEHWVRARTAAVLRRRAS